MARECGDCYFSGMEVGRGGASSWFTCKKKHKRINLSDPACSEFMYEDTKTCDDCEYFESGAFSRWNTRGTCTLRGIKRDENDKACASFYEG